MFSSWFFASLSEQEDSDAVAPVERLRAIKK
jgi:hypothetical protein